MTSREVSCMLVVREGSEGDEVLLEQRATTNTVMPGMWELPALADVASHQHKPILIVRHAIMQVNYSVRVCSVAPEEIAVSDAVRRWVSLREAAAMALTGLARKVLAQECWTFQ
jgi:hypothetical protein